MSIGSSTEVVYKYIPPSCCNAYGFHEEVDEESPDPVSRENIDKYNMHVRDFNWRNAVGWIPGFGTLVAISRCFTVACSTGPAVESGEMKKKRYCYLSGELLRAVAELPNTGFLCCPVDLVTTACRISKNQMTGGMLVKEAVLPVDRDYEVKANGSLQPSPVREMQRNEVQQ